MATIILDGPTESIVSLLHKEEMSGLGLVSGLRQRICLLCYVNSASIFSLTCLPSTHFYNIKIFPDPVKMESELSKNLEFPDGKYLYLMMGPIYTQQKTATSLGFLSFTWGSSGDHHKIDGIMGLGGLLW